MASGENAITSCYALIRALQHLADGMNQDAKQHEWFKDVPQPVKFNPGIVRGGDWPSSTPAWCEISCRLGVLPGVSLDQVRAAVTGTVEAAAKGDPLLRSSPPEIVWNGFLAEGAVLAPGSEAEATLARAHRTVFRADMTPRLSTAVNDTRYYNLYHRIPALCYGPLGEGLHGFDERVNLPNLKRTTAVIALFIAAWCGVRQDGKFAGSDFGAAGPASA